MKKLYRRGTVHPSPPIISDHLSFLPAALLTLTVALSPEDREVLAYLLSSSSVNDFHPHHHHHQKTPPPFSKTSTSTSNSNDHPPLFNCDCFRCYKSYWVRWDTSPNRQLIHEIIDAFEEDQLARSGVNDKKKVKNNKKDKKKRALGGPAKGGGNGSHNSGDLKRTNPDRQMTRELTHESGLSQQNNTTAGGVEEDNTEKGPVRSFVSFIGEKIWGVLG